MNSEYELWVKSKNDKNWSILCYDDKLPYVLEELMNLLESNISSDFTKCKYKICKSGDYKWKKW